MASAHAWQLVQVALFLQLAAQRVAHAFQRKEDRDGFVLVLPTRARLTQPSDFARTTKSGVRVSSTNFVGYLYLPEVTEGCTKAGLIIGKSVGGSVQRHRLSRQVRHALAPLLSNTPEGSLIVIRALSTNSESVESEIETLITKLISKLSNTKATRKAGV